MIKKCTAHDNGTLQYDGIYYDYRDSKAFKSIKLWTPPGPGPVRALMIFGNPGTTGDTRGKALNRSWQDWAAQRQIALAGVTCFPGALVYEKTAKDILQVLKDWAELGDHPELADIPLIPRGSSNAGITAYALSCYAPERIVCASSNVGPNYNPHTPPDELLNVPFIHHIGHADPFFPMGVKDASELFARIHDKRPLWAWDAEEHKGHMDMSQLHTDLAFYSETLEKRLGPYEKGLQPIAYEDGWLADTQTWRKHPQVSDWGVKGEVHDLTYIAPVDSYKGSDQGKVWLPGPKTAKAYQAAATHRRLRQLTIQNLSANSASDGNWDINDADLPTVDPGQTIILQVSDIGSKVSPRTWERIVFYNGNEEIGTIYSNKQPNAQFEYTIKDAAIEQVFSAMAFDAEGNCDISNPFGIVVRDPIVAERVTQQRSRYTQGYSLPTGLTALDNSTSTPNTSEVLNTFQAFPLSQEFGPGLMSTINVGHDFHQGTLKLWESLPSYDLNPSVSIKSVYCPEGLSLLFLFKRNEFPQGDIVDWHISPQDPQSFAQTPPQDIYIRADRALLLKQAQFRLSLSDDEFTLSMNVVRGNLLNMNDLELDLEEAKNYGIHIATGKVDETTLATQWFLPWELVGAPDAHRTQPAQGNHLAIVLGCPESMTDDSKKLRWPYGKDPWEPTPNHFIEPEKAQNAPIWGHLVLA